MNKSKDSSSLQIFPQYIFQIKPQFFPKKKIMSFFYNFHTQKQMV